MTRKPFDRLALIATIMGLGVSAGLPGSAQTLDAGALSPGQMAAGSTIAGAAPQLANAGGEARVDLDLLLSKVKAKAPIAATVPDLSAYSDATMIEMNATLDPEADPCVTAVQSALFLDAHLVETGLWEKIQSIDRPLETLAQIGMIWALPDVYGVTGDGLDILAFRKASPVFKALSIGTNALQSHEVLMKNTIGSVEQRQAIWTQEIVQNSIKNGWNEQIISDRRKYLAGKTQDYVGALAELDKTTEAAMTKAETQYEADLAAIETWEKAQYDALQLNYNVTRIWPDTAAVDLQAVKTEVVSKGQAARNKRHLKLTEIATAYDTKATALLQDIAKAQTQQDALVRYARPIALKECESITKTGLLPKVPLLPSDLDPPYDRDAKDAARLTAILALPHDQLMATLDALGIWPDDAFLSCVCRAAGYGSSGTSQVYHPGTLGTYDKRYSCQHPGDPCVVSGFGCTRHPLPSDPGPWEKCAAAAKGASGQTVTDAILSRLAARRGVVKD